MSGRQAAAGRREPPAGSCPKCRGRQSYRLGDGRLMCKGCRTKYTPAHQVGRLAGPVLQRLAAHFWQMTPTEAAARELRVNRKTVQRYFHLMRARIARQCEARDAEALDSRGPAALFVGEMGSPAAGVKLRDRVTVFGLVPEGGCVRLVFTRPWSDWSGLDLSSLRVEPPAAPRRRPGPTAPEEAAGAFWSFAHKRLRLYRGGFMNTLPLFLREMEFRYNHRHDPGVVGGLLELLRAGPL